MSPKKGWIKKRLNRKLRKKDSHPHFQPKYFFRKKKFLSFDTRDFHRKHHRKCWSRKTKQILHKYCFQSWSVQRKPQILTTKQIIGYVVVCVPVLKSHRAAWFRQNVCQAGRLHVQLFFSTLSYRQLCSIFRGVIDYDIEGKVFSYFKEIDLKHLMMTQMAILIAVDLFRYQGWLFSLWSDFSSLIMIVLPMLVIELFTEFCFLICILKPLREFMLLLLNVVIHNLVWKRPLFRGNKNRGQIISCRQEHLQATGNTERPSPAAIRQSFQQEQFLDDLSILWWKTLFLFKRWDEIKQQTKRTDYTICLKRIRKALSKSSVDDNVDLTKLRLKLHLSFSKKELYIPRHFVAPSRGLPSDFMKRMIKNPPPDKSEELSYIYGRKLTFGHYEGDGCETNLARDGFYHDVNSENRHLTRCYACGLENDSWEYYSNVNYYHRSRSPCCPHVLENDASRHATVTAGRSETSSCSTHNNAVNQASIMPVNLVSSVVVPNVPTASGTFGTISVEFRYATRSGRRETYNGAEDYASSMPVNSMSTEAVLPPTSLNRGWTTSEGQDLPSHASISEVNFSNAAGNNSMATVTGSSNLSDTGVTCLEGPDPFVPTSILQISASGGAIPKKRSSNNRTAVAQRSTCTRTSDQNLSRQFAVNTSSSHCMTTLAYTNGLTTNVSNVLTTFVQEVSMATRVSAFNVSSQLTEICRYGAAAQTKAFDMQTLETYHNVSREDLRKITMRNEEVSSQVTVSTSSAASTPTLVANQTNNNGRDTRTNGSSSGQNYWRLIDRLQSFHNRPFNNPSLIQLAEAGFFFDMQNLETYHNVSREDLRKIGMRNEEVSSQVTVSTSSAASTRTLVANQTNNNGRDTRTNGSSSGQNYWRLNDRQQSFHNWPFNNPSPIQMAEAGFFYTGDDDYVRCFFCELVLHEWIEGEDPWMEHGIANSECGFLHQNKSIDFINLAIKKREERNTGQVSNPLPTNRRLSVAVEPVEDIDPMATRAAILLKRLGYEPELIRRAVQAVWRETGKLIDDPQQTLKWILEFKDRQDSVLLQSGLEEQASGIYTSVRSHIHTEIIPVVTVTTTIANRMLTGTRVSSSGSQRQTEQTYVKSGPSNNIAVISSTGSVQPKEAESHHSKTMAEVMKRLLEDMGFSLDVVCRQMPSMFAQCAKGDSVEAIVQRVVNDIMDTPTRQESQNTNTTNVLQLPQETNLTTRQMASSEPVPPHMPATNSTTGTISLQPVPTVVVEAACQPLVVSQIPPCIASALGSSSLSGSLNTTMISTSNISLAEGNGVVSECHRHIQSVNSQQSILWPTLMMNQPSCQGTASIGNQTNDSQSMIHYASSVKSTSLIASSTSTCTGRYSASTITKSRSCPSLCSGVIMSTSTERTMLPHENLEKSELSNESSNVPFEDLASSIALATSTSSSSYVGVLPVSTVCSVPVVSPAMSAVSGATGGNDEELHGACAGAIGGEQEADTTKMTDVKKKRRKKKGSSANRELVGKTEDVGKTTNQDNAAAQQMFNLPPGVDMDQMNKKTSALLQNDAQLKEQFLNLMQSFAKEKKSMTQHIEKIIDDRLCCVCLDKAKEIIFLPCRHLVCCADCASRQTNCPMCRAIIEEKKKVYQS